MRECVSDEWRLCVISYTEERKIFGADCPETVYISGQFKYNICRGKSMPRKRKTEETEEKGKGPVPEKAWDVTPKNQDMVLTPGDRMLMAMGKETSKSSQAVRDHLVQTTMKNALASKDGEGVSLMERLEAVYFDGLLKNGVTSKDMLALLKLNGEDVSKTQSVKVTVNSTDAYLAELAHGGKKQE